MKIPYIRPASAVSVLLSIGTIALSHAATNPHDQASALHRSPSSVDARIAATLAPTAAQIAEAARNADTLIARQDLAAYRGWLKYLKFRATADTQRKGADSPEAKTAYLNLIDWTAKIAADPDTIGKLRGVQEWAYESQADGSGQPFRINIPTDYDPANPAGLSIYCHGYSGNHIEHSAGMTPHAGRFEIAVLGRARGGMYRMLAERDVLDVLTYVKKTWVFDEDRVDLNGGSMGGFASMWFGSRYPDLFACARPSCGFALQTPTENMANLPVYSLHSKDDPVVHVIDSRGPLQFLRDSGGLVIMEETTGFGHGVWGWSEGQARSAEWGALQVRPDPKSVREIRYTAIDGVATGAWWAHVAEWGPIQAPAVINLKLGPANILYGTLTNITRLRLDLSQSPVDRSQPLQLSLDAGRTISLAAPLPATVDIVMTPDGAKFAEPTTPVTRPHAPGAAALVYDGSSLLIVYGSQGDASTNTALRDAAVTASKSPNASWPADNFQNAPEDGISHYQNLYGQLPIKADTEVTEADLATNNLVLLGTAAQNSLVARIEGKLPVSAAADTLNTSDGNSYPTVGNAWSLVHFNPLAPRRLVLWLASNDSQFYQAGALLPRELFNHGYGADFVVMSPEGRVSAARSFDNQWNWSADYAKSPVLPASAATKAGWATLQADLFRRATGADFGMAMKGYKTNWILRDSFMAVAGVTRYADMALLNYEFRLFLTEIKGSDLIRLREQLSSGAEAALCMSANFATAEIKPEVTYTVTVDWDSLSPLSEQLHLLPQTVRATGIWESAAIATESAH